MCEVCVILHDWLRRRDVPSVLAHTVASVSDIPGLVAQQLLSIQPASLIVRLPQVLQGIK